MLTAGGRGDAAVWRPTEQAPAWPVSWGDIRSTGRGCLQKAKGAMEAWGLQCQGLDWCLSAFWPGVWIAGSAGSWGRRRAPTGCWPCLAASRCLWFVAGPGWPPHGLPVLREDSREHSSWGSFRGRRGCGFHSRSPHQRG